MHCAWPFCSPGIFKFVQLCDFVSMLWHHCPWCNILCVPLYIVGSGRAESPWLCICLCCSRRLLASSTGFSNWVLRLMWLKIQCSVTNNGEGINQSISSSRNSNKTMRSYTQDFTKNKSMKIFLLSKNKYLLRRMPIKVLNYCYI